MNELDKSFDGIRPYIKLEEITDIMARSGEKGWSVSYQKNPFPYIKIDKPVKRLTDFLIDCKVPFEFVPAGFIKIDANYVQIPIRDDI